MIGAVLVVVDVDVDEVEVVVVDVVEVVDEGGFFVVAVAGEASSKASSFLAPTTQSSSVLNPSYGPQGC